MLGWDRCGVLLLSLCLAACQSTGGGAYLSASELEPFTPLSVDQRSMNVVKLRWEVRQDVAEYCANSMGMDKERAYTTPPLACAIWSVRNKECTIVTGPRTTHLALGHEVRHCFEGHFHH
ncbi:MAG: hypothetical protein FJY36_03820 [Betaproteobacteria bacterium]|nr:hypothetical protein [Betaproteobacteria bacterium]